MKIPFHELFTKMQLYDRGLRHQSISLESWLVLLQSLADGYGLVSPADLYALCRLIWLKPHHDERAFREYFALYLAQAIMAEEEAADAQASDPSERSDASVHTPNTPKTKTKSPPQKPPKEQPKPETADTSEPSETSFQTVRLSFAENMAAALQQDGEIPNTEAIEKDVYAQAFQLKGDYLPLTWRKMQQQLRALRLVEFSGPKTHIDLNATIDKVAREGFLTQTIRHASPRISNALVLLIDVSPSMMAFRQLQRKLIEAAHLSIGAEAVQVWYFNNCPTRYLYADAKRRQSVPVQQINQGERRPMLVFSDAGAARGRLSEERVRLTRRFLKTIRQPRVAWLNPMPRQRWTGSSADYISDFHPMFDISEEEFGNVMKFFKR